MTEAQVKISKTTLSRLASGETITIRVGRLVNLAISLAPETPPKPPDPPKRNVEWLMDQLFGKREKGL